MLRLPERQWSYSATSRFDDRQLRYKQAWRNGLVVVADRWYPSSKLCSECGTVRDGLTLADRVFTCTCGHSMDRDRNAAVNLARWGPAQKAEHDRSRFPDPQVRGRATNARRREGADQHPSCAGETTLRVPVKPPRMTRDPTFTLRPRREPTTPEKGGVDDSPELFVTL